MIEHSNQHASHGRLFWVLIATASVAEALAAATFAAAIFSDPVALGRASYAPTENDELFGRVVSLGWSTEKGMLITSIVCVLFGLAAYVIAFRSRSTLQAVDP